MQVWRGIFLAMLFAMTNLCAFAGTVHDVRFQQTARILVWQEGALIGEGQSIDLFETGSVETLGSGNLLPVSLDTPFVGQSARFEIASNSAFVLESNNPLAGQNINIRIVSVGDNAEARPMPTMTGSNELFRQSAKTAVRRGQPKSQALTLEISWTGAAPPNLSVRVPVG